MQTEPISKITNEKKDKALAISDPQKAKKGLEWKKRPHIFWTKFRNFDHSGGLLRPGVE